MCISKHFLQISKEQAFSNHLHVLEEIPVKALGESQSCEWRGSCSWGWPPRQYGAQCKVWGIHNLLLHCADDYSLCTYSGSVAYEKLCAALTQNSLVRGIKQASPFAQTSCLEGFHSLLNQFAPKMIGYSYVGLYCRHILAVVHFNLNLQRQVKCKESDGSERVRVSYPKFKNGEATVREVKVKADFGYVEEIYQTYLESTKKELDAAALQLKEMAPAPMNSMLDKQPREEAIEKRARRMKMTVEDVAPTSTPISEQITSTEAQQKGAAKPRRQYKCPVCKNPMKGHKNVDCPKNRK
ncbi:uncharacterized protein [Acropora muricata]|uniref:uncharacterized protein n=1 Tax=Acropora muricata TaxID=159855 RepID=UPI0034E3A360